MADHQRGNRRGRAPTARPIDSRRVTVVLVVAALVPSALVVALTASRSLEYGHYRPWWYYPDQSVTLHALLVAGLALPCVVLGTLWAVRFVARHEARTVLGCLAGGLLLQGTVIDTDWISVRQMIINRDNSFYAAARSFGIRDFLHNFHEIQPTLSVHLKANMPGKVVFYQLLTHLTHDPRTIGYVIECIAGLGSVAVYLIARLIYEDRRTAIIAMILYLVTPARIVFLVFANNLTVVVAVTLFLVALIAVRARSATMAFVTGVLVYILLFFEPTPFVLLPTFVVVAITVGCSTRFRRSQLVWIVVLPVASFLAVHGLMLLIFGFNVFDAAAAVARDARNFNPRAHRSYVEFLEPNAREFLVHAGVVVSVIVVASCVWAIYSVVTRRRSIDEVVRRPSSGMPLILCATLGALIVVGVTRGEVTRLWIFLAVFFAIAAADVIRKLPRWVAPAAAAVSVVQAVLAVNTMSFIVPKTICHDCGLVRTGITTPVIDVALLAGIALASVVMSTLTGADDLQ